MGYANPRVNRVIEAQAKKAMHLGWRFPNELTENGATSVLDLVGMEDGKCVFLSSGSEAVELGAQIARRLTDKEDIIDFLGCLDGILEKAG